MGFFLPSFWHPDLCSRSPGSATISYPHPCCMLTRTLEVALSPSQVARGIAAVGTFIPPWDLKFVLPRWDEQGAELRCSIPVQTTPCSFCFHPHTTWKHLLFPNSRALKVSRKAEILSPLGALYYNTGRYEEALQVYREAASLQPSNKEIRLALVSVGRAWPGQGHGSGAPAAGCSIVY